MYWDIFLSDEISTFQDQWTIELIIYIHISFSDISIKELRLFITLQNLAQKKVGPQHYFDFFEIDTICDDATILNPHDTAKLKKYVEAAKSALGKWK